MSDELEKKILEDIQKTGFASELKVVSHLISKNWSTTHSNTFEDWDEKKSREIDVTATKVEYLEEFGFRFIFHLIIEVKKSSKPWIVFTTNRNFSTPGWRTMHCGFNTYRDNSSIFDVKTISENHIRENELRIGKAFHEFQKSPGDNSQIFGSLISASKAAVYYKNLYKRDTESEFGLDEESQLDIYLPTIVFDGNLYDVHSNYLGELELEKKNYIPVELSYSSPHYRIGNWDPDFLPDIVTLDDFLDHINKIEKWRLSMIEKIKVQLKEIGKMPDKRWADLRNELIAKMKEEKKQ